MAASESRQLLFVLGMHRTGTSALCAALQACGASFGSSLLGPMQGVNDEGFWEDAEVVAINEALLQQVGVAWYSVTPAQLGVDWIAQQFSALRERARAVLARGFGGGALEAIKDPRLCITAPFWLSLCDELGIGASFCVISRAPIEVARSLQRRDGFPPGYGLRLDHCYRLGIERHAPPEAAAVTYDDLLFDPAAAMRRLAALLPLTVPAAPLGAVVRRELRRQHSGGGAGPLYEAGSRVDTAALAAAIEEHYPVDQTLAALAEALAERGLELTRIGEAHAEALRTLDQRDADIAGLSAEHQRALATIDERDQQLRQCHRRLSGLGEEHGLALATIDERDQQIRDFDRRLSRLGGEHSHALQVIRQRDAQLDRIYSLPGVGRVVRRMLNRAQG